MGDRGSGHYPNRLRRQVAYATCAVLVAAGLACDRENPLEPVVAMEEEANHRESVGDSPSSLDEIVDSTLGSHLEDRYSASLDSVLEKRFLRVLTSRNAFDYFLRGGEPGGYQYEMVREFTRHLNQKYAPGRRDLEIQFELLPVADDQLIPMLLDGAADLVAARLTVTDERRKRVRFSNAYRKVEERLLTHDETPPVVAIGDLAGSRVAVRPSSSYFASLERLNARLIELGRTPVEIEPVDEALETEQILALVAARRFDYSVADSVVADLMVSVHPKLRVVENIALRSDGEWAWATRPGANKLLEEMNAFLARYEQGSLLGNLGIRHYFESESKGVARLVDGPGEELSEFDSLFKRHADRFGIDWRLVASMAYQESRFDPEARNRSGAVGLLQIKPTTAREPYIAIPEVAGREHADENVEAGLKYLGWIKARYFDSIPAMREKDRLRMALAAYNAGPRTLARARRRATELGHDPNRWFRHVELALLDMGKIEPVKYVSEINQRYLAYRILGLE